jgi:mRNA-degrading endonuclease YafQ of YafQ-DinJ toxin-antitoxin module
MKYFFSKIFEKKFDKLDVRIQDAFYKRFDIFCENSFSTLLNNHSVDPLYKNTRSINITGDYRALFVKESDTIVIFTNIGTHSELYD